MTQNITTAEIAAAAADLNIRQIGILMTGKNGANDSGLIVGTTTTRKALERRGLVDERGYWTPKGRAVVAHIDNPPTDEPAAGKTAAEARADEIAGWATLLGHTVERVADPAEGVFEVIVRGRYETLQTVVRQSKFPSRSSVWAQRFGTGSSTSEARRVAAGELRTIMRGMPPIAPVDVRGPADVNVAVDDDRIPFEYLNADTRLHRATGVQILRIGGIWHVQAPGDEPRTGGNPDTMIDNIMGYAHTVVRAELAQAAKVDEIGLDRVHAGHYTHTSGVEIIRHEDGKWWAWAPKAGTSERRLLCAFRDTLRETLPYVAEWLDELTIAIEQDMADAQRAAGVTFAYVPRAIDADSVLTVEGEAFPIPERHEEGGTMSLRRIGEALRDAGYRIDAPAFAEVRHDAGAAGIVYRVHLLDFEPVRDADGNPVPLPATVPMHRVDLATMRELFAGRVPAPGCPHYIARSERDAGLRTCEKRLCVQVEHGRRTGCAATTGFDGPHAFVEDPHGLVDRDALETCRQVPDSDVHTRTAAGIPEVATIGAGDDRQLDQAAAAECAAVLADPLTHGGKVEPHLFTEGPAGEHVEMLCEVHGAATVARLATAADVARIAERTLAAAAGAPLDGEVLDRLAEPELLGSGPNGFAVRLGPRSGAVVADPGDNPIERLNLDAVAGGPPQLAGPVERDGDELVDELVAERDGFHVGDLVRWGGSGHSAHRVWRIARIYVPRDGAEPYAGLDSLTEANTTTAGYLHLLVRVEVPELDAGSAAAIEKFGYEGRHDRAAAVMALTDAYDQVHALYIDRPDRTALALALGVLRDLGAAPDDSDDAPKINNPAPDEAELLRIETANADITAALDALRAAVELHRPALLNKHAQPTDDPADAKWIRCNACHESVPAAGCPTWQAAHPQ